MSGWAGIPIAGGGKRQRSAGRESQRFPVLGHNAVIGQLCPAEETAGIHVTLPAENPAFGSDKLANQRFGMVELALGELLPDGLERIFAGRNCLKVLSQAIDFLPSGPKLHRRLDGTVAFCNQVTAPVVVRHLSPACQHFFHPFLVGEHDPAQASAARFGAVIFDHKSQGNGFQRGRSIERNRELGYICSTRVGVPLAGAQICVQFDLNACPRADFQVQFEVMRQVGHGQVKGSAHRDDRPRFGLSPREAGRVPDLFDFEVQAGSRNHLPALAFAESSTPKTGRRLSPDLAA